MPTTMCVECIILRRGVCVIEIYSYHIFLMSIAMMFWLTKSMNIESRYLTIPTLTNNILLLVLDDVGTWLVSS